MADDDEEDEPPPPPVAVTTMFCGVRAERSRSRSSSRSFCVSSSPTHSPQYFFRPTSVRQMGQKKLPHPTQAPLADSFGCRVQNIRRPPFLAVALKRRLEKMSRLANCSDRPAKSNPRGGRNLSADGKGVGRRVSAILRLAWSSATRREGTHSAKAQWRERLVVLSRTKADPLRPQCRPKSQEFEGLGEDRA